MAEINGITLGGIAGIDMTLEIAILDIKPGLENDFEKSFLVAQKIISSITGYIFHELKKCVENKSRYVLLVNWETLEDHTLGFRGSKEYQEWKNLLHHYYDPFPTVEHYQSVNRPE
jgi:heme-degrading monooxygenase HmoA